MRLLIGSHLPLYTWTTVIFTKCATCAFFAIFFDHAPTSCLHWAQLVFANLLLSERIPRPKYDWLVFSFLRFKPRVARNFINGKWEESKTDKYIDLVQPVCIWFRRSLTSSLPTRSLFVFLRALTLKWPGLLMLLTTPSKPGARSLCPKESGLCSNIGMRSVDNGINQQQRSC